MLEKIYRSLNILFSLTTLEGIFEPALSATSALNLELCQYTILPNIKIQRANTKKPVSHTKNMQHWPIVCGP